MAKVLVVGSGAREHALSRQLLLSSEVDQVFCAPGNLGMSADGIEVVSLSEMDFDGLVAFAKKHQVDLTVIGPEQPLQQGIVDQFLTAGLKVFGPTKAAAALEGSKAFAKQIMAEANVPTAKYASYANEEEAMMALNEVKYPVVIKANGLAAGKGVVVAQDNAAARNAIHQMLGEHQFNTESIIIEEFLVGQEFSLMAMINGDQIVPMPLSQDHKPAYDGDQGPNTGGMGAYSPLRQFPTELVDEGVETIIRPVIETLKQHKIPFCGVLYAGLIMTLDGPKVIEFNVRLGDPETVVVLPQMKSDLYKLLQSLLNCKPIKAEWQEDQLHLGVVVSSESYPQSSASGAQLEAFAKTPTELCVNYAGVKADKAGKLVSNGGRILCVTTKANDMKHAQDKLYSWLEQQELTGLRYRRDIGDKEKSR